MQEIEFHRALHRPGTIIDAGAHDGGLTLPLAALPGSKVIAFEPLPPAFRRLREAAIRAGAPITVRPEALCNSFGVITLSVPRVGGTAQEQWASIAKDYTALRHEDPGIDGVDDYTVPAITLDSLGLTDLTAMKIDVEGAEQEVLRGSLETLRRCRPVLSIEIEERHRPGSIRGVPALLRPLGYEGYFEFWRNWRPIETLDIATMQRGSPSPAAYDVSEPYIFCFYFITNDRRPELTRLARLPERPRPGSAANI
jgi:FkbM family methyltransferase